MKVKDLITHLLNLDMEKQIRIDITPPPNEDTHFINIDHITDHGDYYLII